MNATLIRRLLLLLVVAALGFGAWKLANPAATADPFVTAESRLQPRIDEYIAHRIADDWIALYPLTDPEHRKQVTLRNFLAMYGQGLLKVHAIRVNAVRFDRERRTAEVDLTTEAELVQDRLPAEFRNLREEHPEHLRKTADHTLNWIWRGDGWYFEMDQELVTGMTSDGKPIQLTPPSGEAPLVPPAPGS